MSFDFKIFVEKCGISLLYRNAQCKFLTIHKSECKKLVTFRRNVKAVYYRLHWSADTLYLGWYRTELYLTWPVNVLSYSLLVPVSHRSRFQIQAEVSVVASIDVYLMLERKGEIGGKGNAPKSFIDRYPVSPSAITLAD